MLRAISRLFWRPSPRPRVLPVPVRIPVRAKYDAAQTNEDNRRHWAMADGLSAAAANNPSVRRILRNRARYEYANNTYCKGIVDTLANHTVGYGPTLKVDTGDPAANARIENAFNSWARETRLASKLRTMRKAKAVDGEAFAVLTTNNRLRSPVKLDVRLVEADQVTDPSGKDTAADGINFDSDGNPVNYMVLRDHPGSGQVQGSDVPAIPAASVIHWFGADRPGQVRGIPDIMSALPLFAQLRRYALAVLAAAETAADFAAILYTNAPANGEADEVDPFMSFEIEQRQLTTVPQGWQLGQLKAEQPTSTFGEAKREYVNEIARCVHMPFNVAACNSSGYNYSSGQLDHQTYDVAIEIEQDDVEIVILMRIWYAWLEEAALVPGLLTAGPYGDWAGTVQYLWPSRGHADPTKNASATETELRTNMTTLAREYARKGLDWEKEIEQRARENEKLKTLGLSATVEPQSNSTADQEASDVNQEETPATSDA